MWSSQIILFVAVAAASIIAVIAHLSRQRRDALGQFERLFSTPDVVLIKEYRYGDESETSTSWFIDGTAGEYTFFFEAKDSRAEHGALLYTLNIAQGTPQLHSNGFGFGGEHMGSRGDQKRLAKLFERIWPVGRYPAPDLRAARLRMFLSRS